MAKKSKDRIALEEEIATHTADAQKARKQIAELQEEELRSLLILEALQRVRDKAGNTDTEGDEDPEA